jgi:hypothetical protein
MSYSFIHTFNKYVLIAKYVPEIVLGGARFIAVMSLGKFEGK